MFRFKLTSAIVALLSLILMLSAILYWGTIRSEYYFERSQRAQDAAQAYVQLSHSAYRHFKELVDIVVLDGDASVEQAKLTYQQLHDSLDGLREAINAEIVQIDEEEKEHEIRELNEVKDLEKLLTEGVWAFERIVLLQRRGADEPAKIVLETVLEETIDQQFKPLIDRAINEELSEMAFSRQQAQELLSDLKNIATVTALLAIFLALILAIWLLRNLRYSLQNLVGGVRKVSKGDLAHRIVLPGRDEFTYLAKKFNDMTQRLAEKRQSLLLAQSELEEKVESRTSELQQANDKLQLIDAGRRRFFGDISHELRTPLAAIRGEAEVTLRGKSKQEDEYKEALQRIVEMSGQMAKLVEDLLFMARSESTSFRFELHPLVMNVLIVELCDDAGVLAQNQQLTLRLELPDQDINVCADRVRLRQLLLILIDNACLYSKPGGEVSIVLKIQDHSVCLEVCDQGIGIPEAELESVFDRFYRGELARKRVPSGSGLGLPLAKSIVEGHQGKISINSEIGKGTCVMVRLPAMLEADSFID